VTQIRALRREDIPQVVALYRSHLAWPHYADREELVAGFARIFLGRPLSDPDVPSLVLEGAGGQVQGFLGSLVHRMQFDHRQVRLACSSSLVVAPQARQLGGGAFLLRKYLAGPQDLTITDTAGGPTEIMWKRLGGATDALASMTWLYPIHPLRMAAGIGLWRLGRYRWLPLARPLCRPLDAAYARWISSDVPKDGDRLSEEPLSPQLLIDHLCMGSERARLWPDYDPASLDQRFAEIGSAGAKGRIVKSFVRGPRGEPVGWYMLYLLPSEICYVLHLAPAPKKEQILLNHVLRKARQLKVAAISGRLAPWLLEVLPSRVIMFSRVKFLYHSRDDAIRDAVRSGQAVVTGLEGDIWMPS
jgi:hypothetical protein